MRKREINRDCAHARLVTCDGEIEITVSITRSHVYIYKIFAPVARLGGLAPARPIMYLLSEGEIPSGAYKGMVIYYVTILASAMLSILGELGSLPLAQFFCYTQK